MGSYSLFDENLRLRHSRGQCGVRLGGNGFCGGCSWVRLGAGDHGVDFWGFPGFQRLYHPIECLFRNRVTLLTA